MGAGTNYDSTNTGWTAGGGLEWFPLASHPLFRAFSVKVEYLYTDLGPDRLFGGLIAAAPSTALATGFAYHQTSETRWHTVRLGVNWHFNPFVGAPLPVLASY